MGWFHPEINGAMGPNLSLVYRGSPFRTLQDQDFYHQSANRKTWSLQKHVCYSYETKTQQGVVEQKPRENKHGHICSPPSTSEILEDWRSTPTWQHAFLLLSNMLNWDWDNYCPNYRRFGIWLVARRPIPNLCSKESHQNLLNYDFGASYVSL